MEAGGVWRRRKKVDPDERTPALGLRLKDLLLMDQLVKAGAVLTEPRHVRAFLYFEGEVPAAQAANGLRSHGWTAGAAPARASSRWVVEAEQHDVVLTPEFVRTATDVMEDHARAFGGEYDGWEASV
jgi:hypothetical protein